jgi:hypothetical protein
LHADEVRELHEGDDTQVLVTGLDGLEVLERHPQDVFGETLLGHSVLGAYLGDAPANVIENTLGFLSSHSPTVEVVGRCKNLAMTIGPTRRALEAIQHPTPMPATVKVA